MARVLVGLCASVHGGAHQWKITVTGTGRVRVVPSPIWPDALSPQQRMVASFMRAQTWRAPTATSTISNTPKTSAGVLRLRVVESPSSLCALDPQQERLASCIRAQVVL